MYCILYIQKDNILYQVLVEWILLYVVRLTPPPPASIPEGLPLPLYCGMCLSLSLIMLTTIHDRKYVLVPSTNRVEANICSSNFVRSEIFAFSSQYRAK